MLVYKTGGRELKLSEAKSAHDDDDSVGRHIVGVKWMTRCPGVTFWTL